MRGMRHGSSGAWVLAATLPLVGAAGTVRAGPPPGGPVPLPLVGRQTVRAEGRAYLIDGKQVIPGGSVIRVEANVKIHGVNGASLEVKGGFLVHGTQECWVSIDGVDFSPTVAPDNEVHFDMADVSDCTWVHGEKQAFDGGLVVENSCWQGSCRFEPRIRSGYVRIMTSEFKMPVRIESVPDAGTPPEIAIRTSWMKATSLIGNARATVRDSECRGLLDGRNFTFLEIDGVDLFGGCALHLLPEASWSKCSLLKCNLFSEGQLVLDRPKTPRTKMEKVRVDKFHFESTSGKAEMDDAGIAARIVDGADDEHSSVKAFVQNPQERKHEFLSPYLRPRAPP